MKYSTNYNMNKPERADQYNLDHWNENTEVIDTELKRNADNISTETTRASNAETALRNITDETFKTTLLNFCYPVGSLYWSSKSTNPSTLFGGTWTQIKDKFIWAKGDDDAVNATGGAKTVTLTIAQMPNHNHGGSTGSGGVDHTHDMLHRHYSGGTTGGMSAHSSGYFGGSGYSGSSLFTSADNSTFTLSDGGHYQFDDGGGDDRASTVSMNIQHTHSWGDWDSTPRYWGNEGVERYNTGTASAYLHVHSITANGSGQAHENMPPYIVKYCWERTA